MNEIEHPLSGMLPRDVECPHCGAKVDHGCHSKYQPHRTARTHRARWTAVGVKRPAPSDLYLDNVDGEMRDHEYRRLFFEQMRELAAEQIAARPSPTQTGGR